MRVIGGEFRSRVLKSVPGLTTRPTPDRMRETLFNILAPEIAGCSFLDAYAGSGAVGIEALSRGASQAIFLEKQREAVDVIKENVASLRLGARADVVYGRVLQRLERYRADIVFLDPPYELEAEYSAALEQISEWTPLPRVVIAQHSVRLVLADEFGALARTRMVKQGDNVLGFYRPKES
jgi:16S rRNA (guanine966-N2)-methyltransferase